MPSRVPCTSSSGHSLVNVDWNDSITSTSTYSESTVIEPSFSVDESLYGDNSPVSTASSLSLPYPGTKIPIPLEGDHPRDQGSDREYAEDGEFYYPGGDESALVDFALLSHLAVRLRDHVPRGVVKGRMPYPRAFTGMDLLVSGIELAYDSVERNSYHYSVNHSGPNKARNVHQPPNLDGRSKGGRRGRS